MEKAAIKSKSSMMQNEDNDVKLLAWYKPIPLKVTNREPFSPGANSKEKENQANREKCVLQEIYFSREMIPDTPKEMDPGIDQDAIKSNEPSFIPTEDKEEDRVVHQYKSGWPEPKENQVSQQASLESQFSLTPAMSALLSNINKGGLEAIIPPINILSKEEQDTLDAQMKAMKELGVLPTVNNQPPSGPPPVQHPPPDFHQRFPPPTATQYSQPPPFGGPPNPGNHGNHGNPGNNHRNGFYHQPPPSFGNGADFHRNGGRGGGYRGYKTGGPPPSNRGGYNRDFRENRWDDRNGGRGGGRPCKFYTGKGSCRDGDSCRYIHELPPRN